MRSYYLVSSLNNTYRTTFIFFPLFIISILFYIPNIGGSGYSLPFNAFTLFSLGIVTFTLIHIACLKNKFTIDKFFIASCFFLLAITIPFFWSDNAQAFKALPRFFTIILGLVYYFSLCQYNPSKEQITLLLFVICISTFISSCFSLYQNYLMTKHSYFAIKIEYGRPTGIFQQVNVLASYTSTGLAIALYLLKVVKKSNFTVLLTAVAFVNIWVLFLTQSRTGLLAGAIIALYYLFTYLKEKSYKSIVLFTTLILLAHFLAKNLPYSSGNEYVVKKDVISTPQIRLYIYSDSLGLFLQKPFTGHGYGSFHNEILKYSATKSAVRENINYGKRIPHPHNELLLWIVEGGVLIAVSFLVLFSYFFYLIYNGINNYKACLLLILLPIFLHTQTEHPFYQSTLHFIVFITIVYSIIRLCNIKSLEIKPNVSLIKITSLLFTTFLFIFSITALQSTIKLRRYIYIEPNNHILLSEALNPLIEYKFKEIQINTLKLEIAIRSNDINSIQQFIDWTDTFLLAFPSDYVHFEKIRALKALDYKNKAEQETNIAKTLYPQNKSWDSAIWTPSKY